MKEMNKYLFIYKYIKKIYIRSLSYIVKSHLIIYVLKVLYYRLIAVCLLRGRGAMTKTACSALTGWMGWP